MFEEEVVVKYTSERKIGKANKIEKIIIIYNLNYILKFLFTFFY